MPVFTKLYIKHSEGSDPIVLDNVTGWGVGEWDVIRTSYRDTGWTTGKVNTWPDPTAPSGTSAVAPYVASELPVVGTGKPNHTAWTELKHAPPDEVAHHPWRPKRERLTGYFFVFTEGGTLPTIPTPDYAAVAFTVNSTTNVCSATAHGFNNGDLVAVNAATTLAAPLAAATVYKVLKVNADSFMLATLDDVVVDFSNTGTGTQSAVLMTPAKLPAINTGFIFVPFAWNPRVSTSNPDA